MAGSRILVLYSSPSDEARLRLDKEHRELDSVLREYKSWQDSVVRMHATTPEDFVRAMRGTSFELVQFSGHGSPGTFKFEDGVSDQSRSIDAKHMAGLLKEAAPHLRAAVFMCCFSSESIPVLQSAAPFLITIEGNPTDASAIEFITEFYRDYFENQSIEHAYRWASLYCDLKDQPTQLRPLLTRRATSQTGYVVNAGGLPCSDSVYVDLSPVQHEIESLGQEKVEFLSSLSRKLRLHRWIFSHPNESAVISIGRYLGVFAWENADDVVRCEKILKIRPSVDDTTCERVLRFLVGYNDLRVAKYRTLERPAAPENAHWLRSGLAELRSRVDWISLPDNQMIFKSLVPDHLKVTVATASANLAQAEVDIDREQFARAVMRMEAGLSSIHDLITALIEHVTVAASGSPT